MDRVTQLAAHFKVPAMVCVNKFDLNADETRTIEAYAAQKGLTMVGKVPFDPVFTKAMVQGQTVLEYDKDSEGGQAVREVWLSVCNGLEI
jgi:MinD superfamily P-loop ATPase